MPVFELSKKLMRHLLTASVILVGIQAVAFGQDASDYKTADCIECHWQEATKSIMKIDVYGFSTSVHASRFRCFDCHQGVTSDKHISQAGSGAVNCARCHQKLNRHGGTVSSEFRPQCHQCHTRHKIFRTTDPASTVYRQNLKQTCQRCHPEESGQMSYLSWLPSIRIESHNKQDLGTSYEKDDCLACHQGQAAHGESETLVQDKCYRCHMTPDGKNALLGTVHPKADRTSQPGVYAIAFAYQFGVVFLLWGGLRRLIRRYSNDSGKNLSN